MAARLARYLGRHIPGNPQIVPQNMPGAGSLKLVNYLYNVAPKDGTAIGIFAPGIVAEPLLGHGDGTQFDATKFGWLGSVSHEVSVCAFMASTGIASLAGHADQADRHRRLGRRRRERRVRDRPAQHVPHADPHRHRLSGRHRDHARDGAPRGRRPLRLVVDQPAEPQQGDADGQGDQRHAADRA